MELSKSLKVDSTKGGFFSCSTLALDMVIRYLKNNKELPKELDRSAQYSSLKERQTDDLASMYFMEETIEEIITPIDYNGFSLNVPFKDYEKIPFERINPIIEGYFTPSWLVVGKYTYLLEKYDLDPSKLISIINDGSDIKSKEKSYNTLIDKAYELQEMRLDDKFLVLSDDLGFNIAFLKEFPEAIVIDEAPYINAPIEQRADINGWLFAALLVASESDYLITKNGHLSLWSILYRGNSDNIIRVK